MNKQRLRPLLQPNSHRCVARLFSKNEGAFFIGIFHGRLNFAPLKFRISEGHHLQLNNRPFGILRHDLHGVPEKSQDFLGRGGAAK